VRKEGCWRLVKDRDGDCEYYSAHTGYVRVRMYVRVVQCTVYGTYLGSAV
jgi:hypothetical protein